MTKKELLHITAAARKRINVLLRGAPPETIALRLLIRKGGCSGYKYDIEYASHKDPLEEEISWDDGRLFISPEILVFVSLGSTMDYKISKLESGFDFINPNEKGRCGCGESVSF